MLLLRLRWGCWGGSIRESWQVRPGRGMWGGWGGWVPGIGGPGGDKNGGRSGRCLGGDPVKKEQMRMCYSHLFCDENSLEVT